MRLSRKSFLQSSLALVATAAGCGGGDEEEKSAAGSCSADIVSNHTPGHTLSVPKADLDAGQARTYSIQGGADHTHSVIISAPNMERLKNGESISLTSSNEQGHEHPITVVCS